MDAAFATMNEWLREESRPGAFEAKQSALARFTKSGFEAAAVTQMSMFARSAPSPHQVTERRATVRFNHPYVVVAFTTTRAPDPASPWRTKEVASLQWNSVPVFTAWVDLA